MVISVPAQVTESWLNSVLSDKGYLRQTEGVSVEEVSGHSGYYSVRVEYTPSRPLGLPAQFFLKLHSPGPNAIVEVFCYTDLIPSTEGLCTIPCFDAVIDESTGAAHVLLADVSSTHSAANANHLMTIDRFSKFTEQLAILHGRWWDDSTIRESTFMPQVNTAMAYQDAVDSDRAYQSWNEYVHDYLPRHSHALQAVGKHDLVAMARLCVDAWHDLRSSRIKGSSCGLTIIHGDAHVGNFMVHNSTRADPSLVFDFDVCMRSVGVFDLAFLVLMYEQASGERVDELESIMVWDFWTGE